MCRCVTAPCAALRGEVSESAEGARLLSEYTGINLYQGFKSLPLRHREYNPLIRQRVFSFLNAFSGSTGLYFKKRGKGILGRPFGSTSKRGAKEFWGGHSGTIFSSLSAEDADTQAVVFKIPEAVRSSLDELHFPVEAFGNPVVLREAEHPGNLFLP